MLGGFNMFQSFLCFFSMIPVERMMNLNTNIQYIYIYLQDHICHGCCMNMNMNMNMNMYMYMYMYLFDICMVLYTYHILNK